MINAARFLNLPKKAADCADLPGISPVVFPAKLIMLQPEHKQPAAAPDYRVYLLRLRRNARTGKWYISLQPAQESRQRVFTDLDSLSLYLEEQMRGGQNS